MELQDFPHPERLATKSSLDMLNRVVVITFMDT